MKSSTGTNPFEISGNATNGKYPSYIVNRSSRYRLRDIDEWGTHEKATASTSAVNMARLWFWVSLISIALLILTARTAYLQLFEGEYFRSVAEGNRIRVRDIKATRGIMYDRRDQPLVRNVPSVSLAVVPVDLPTDQVIRRELFAELAAFASSTPDQVEEIVKKSARYSYQPVVLKDGVTHEEAILIEILSNRYSGVELQSSSIRQYDIEQSGLGLSHLLGYVGRIEDGKLDSYIEQGYSIDDYTGKSGVEFSYEKELKGRNGHEQVEVDAIGEAKEILASDKPVPGSNLVLTIDAGLQKQAEDSLNRALKTVNMRRGSVIALDPRSGEVLALVSLPAFDSNAFSRGIDHETYNALIADPNRPLFSRSVSGEYASGSTIKMVMAAAALEENIINRNTSFSSSGGISVGRWFFPDWKAGGHGTTNVVKALAESVNTFFYIIGGGYDSFSGLGIEKMKQYAERFGLSKSLGIDLPNEASGFYPSQDWKEEVKKELWYIGDTYHAAIGQGDVLVTPLQVAAYTSVFANGGTLYRPHVVKEVRTSDNVSITKIEPTQLMKHVVKPEVVSVVNEGLRQAVVSGSARRLSSLPFAAAAKTGTAQWSSIKAPHAWATAFAPYESPEIVVTVLVEEGAEGSTAAIPVIHEILQWWGENRLNEQATSTDD